MRNHYLISFIFISLFISTSARGYSLLTHEAVIDVSWKAAIEPLLLQKFPGATEEQLVEAHSYAYGGAIMPDIGYSPFGSMIYTNFVHNVRTGDYVTALLDEAETLQEYAFALGSLAHYLADNNGHGLGTNVAVPLLYPKVKAQFGNVVTYADHHLSHSQLEFAFDVLQTARGNYASKNYHDFIGFKVARPVVEKAFYRTYGLQVEEVFGNLGVAIGTYRWMIKSLLPNIVRTAWARKKSDLKKVDSTLTARKFSYRMRNRTYYHEFGKDHQKAGFFPTVVSFLLPVLPKVGPLAKLKFKTPTPEVEKLFIKSFDTTVGHYADALGRLRRNSSLSLENRTLDTGHETAPATYCIADEYYDKFLLLHHEKQFSNLTAEIRQHLISFYDAAPPRPASEEHRACKDVRQALIDLRGSAGLRAGLN